MVRLQVRCFFRPPECRECPKSGRKPCVERILVLCPSIARGWSCSDVRFHILNPSTIARGTALRPVPHRNPMSEPYLPRDAPIAEIVYPVVINLFKMCGHYLDIA